jgi:hypothetical protein
MQGTCLEWYAGKINHGCNCGNGGEQPVAPVADENQPRDQNEKQLQQNARRAPHLFEYVY